MHHRRLHARERLACVSAAWTQQLLAAVQIEVARQLARRHPAVTQVAHQGREGGAGEFMRAQAGCAGNEVEAQLAAGEVFPAHQHRVVRQPLLHIALQPTPQVGVRGHGRSLRGDLQELRRIVLGQVGCGAHDNASRWLTHCCT
jgi:hypothetical protein